MQATLANPLTLIMPLKANPDVGALGQLLGQARKHLDLAVSISPNSSCLTPLSGHLAGFTTSVAANDASQHPPDSKVTMFNAYQFPAELIVADMPT